MPAATIIKPSISIGGTEFKCKSREVSLEPGDLVNFCEYQYTCSIEIELAYGTGESHDVLNGFRDTVQEIILLPSDATIGTSNPSATFSAVIPPIPFMSGAVRGERQTFTLELMSEAEPVLATA